MRKLFIIFILAGVLLPCKAQNVRLPERPATHPYRDYTIQPDGFWCSVEVEGGSSVTLEHSNMQPVALSYTAGYRFNEYLKLGVGIGGRYYVNGNNKCRDTDVKWTFPIYAQLRGNIISGKSRDIVPYWAFSVGGIVRDGFFISPTLGIRLGSDRQAFLLGISYSLNAIDNLPNKPTSRSFMLLRVGYEF